LAEVDAKIEEMIGNTTGDDNLFRGGSLKRVAQDGLINHSEVLDFLNQWDKERKTKRPYQLIRKYRNVIKNIQQ
jgi:hypothetical protein